MRTLATLIIFASVSLLAAALTGCNPSRPPEPPNVSNNLGGARSLVQTAHDAVVAIRGHVDADHEPQRQVAESSLTGADVRLVAAEKANDVLAKTLADSNSRADKAAQALTDERGHWIGYQLRLWGKIIIGCIVAAFIAYEAVAKFTGWGSIIGLAGGLLGKIPFVGRFFGGATPAPNPFSSL